MSVDVVANMLSSIKNASMSGKQSVEVPHTKMCEAIAKIIKARGFLLGVKVFKPSGRSYKKMRLDLDASKITDVKRISKPGRRVYKGVGAAGGYGVTVLSTSRGIMTSEDAKKKNLGGEILCEVW
ncbi:30S ribosomal protein S8 [candidate division WWE3 bacterium]|nr:30S ribosomal protein S8 [candidate division WWE3 bacterium]